MDTDARHSDSGSASGDETRVGGVVADAFEREVERATRHRLVRAILRVVAVLGAVVLAAASYNALRSGLPHHLPVFAGVYVVVVVLALWRRAPYVVHAGVLVALLYLLSISELFEDGLSGSGRVFLLTAIVMTVLLFGRRSAPPAVAVSTAVVAAFGWAHVSGRIEVVGDATTRFSSSAQWLSSSLVFVMLAVVVVVAQVHLIPLLADSLARERRLAHDLQESLNEKEALLALQQATFEATADGIIAVDRNGRITSFNQRFADMWGIPAAVLATGDREQAVQFALELLQDPEGFLGRVRELYADPEAESQDLLALTDGRVFERHSRPQRAGGEIVGRVWDFRDITERARMEERLQASEENYRNFVEQSTEGIWLLEFDPPISIDLAAEEQVDLIQERGRVAQCNDTLARMYGYASSVDMMGVPVLDLYGREANKRRNRQSTLSLVAAGYREDERETREVDVQGDTVYFLNSAVGVIRDRQLLGLWGTQRDITETKRAEAALRQASLVVENSPVTLFRWRAAEGWPVEFASQNVVQFGYTPEELLTGEVPYSSIVYPDDLERVAREVREHTAKGRDRFQQEYRVVTRDGDVRWIDDRTVVERDADGEVTHYQGVILDITERKEAAQRIRRINEELEQRVAQRTRELEAANRELEAFAYSVSHDLRAPLRSIDGFSQAVVEDYGDVLGADGRSSLQRVRVSAQRLGHLIDDLLRLSRVTRQEMTYETVDLTALAHGIVSDLQRGEPERDVELTAAVGVVACGDKHLLGVALENLLANAWKFSGRQPRARIEFGAMTDDGERVFFVRDDGVGFDARYGDKLFKPFERLHPAGEFEGTGIGLATVQRVIARHGGRVWAEGAVEQGATFFFTIGEHGSDSG